MEPPTNECVACGVVLRPTSTRCPSCSTAVVAGAVRRPSVPLDAVAALVDPRRQRISRGLVEVAAALLVGGLILSVGTGATWGVLSAAAYVAIAVTTAPKPLVRPPRPPRSTRDQAVLRQDIATGPARATAGGRAFQTEVEEVFPMYLFMGFGLTFGILFPVVAFATSDSAQGQVAVAMAIAGSLAAWVFRSRRETDAAGFPSRGVPIE